MGVTQRRYLLLLTEYRKHIWAVVREICELNKHLLLVIVMLNEFFLVSVFIILKKGFKGGGLASASINTFDTAHIWTLN